MEHDAFKDINFLVIGTNTKIDRILLSQMKKLIAIISATSGLNHIDLEAACEYKISVYNFPDINAKAVAEYCLMVSMTLMRDLDSIRLHMKNGKWRTQEKPVKEFHNFRIGIWGLGKTGLAFAHLCSKIGLKIIGLSRHRVNNCPPGLEVCHSLFELASTSDLLSIHVPLNQETCGQINASLIKTMRRGSFIVNTSRSDIVNQDALLAAIKSGHIKGAALDVWPSQYDTNYELINHPAVVATPHIAWLTNDTIIKIKEQVMKVLLPYLIEQPK